jgi:hypothetical protein
MEGMNGGYPEEEDLKRLVECANDSEGFEQTAAMLSELCELTGYARVKLESKRLEIATGGWSGCEELISTVRHTLWYVKYWESTHRGGLWIWEVPE